MGLRKLIISLSLAARLPETIARLKASLVFTALLA